VCDRLGDFIGPLFITLQGGDYCLASDVDGKVLSLPIQQFSEHHHQPEPSHKEQVFVANPIVGRESRTMDGQSTSTTTPGTVTISLKNAFGKYLTCDRYGVVSCLHEAIGPQEEWRLVFREDGIALQSIYDGFLHLEQNRIVRSDAQTIGFYQILRIYCQVSLKRERLKNERTATRQSHRHRGDNDDLNSLDDGDHDYSPHANFTLEKELQKKYQSWSSGHEISLMPDLSRLRQAEKQGKLHEAMLDRREKLKSDRFCK
jgi:protein FRG1